MISRTKLEFLDIKEKISLSSGDHFQSVFAVKHTAEACQAHHQISSCPAPTHAIFWLRSTE